MFARKKKRVPHPLRAAAASQSAGNGAGKTAGEDRAPVHPPPALRETLVDKLCGNRRWAAKWLLDLCAADPHFLFHLAAQPRGYAHYLCVLQLALPAQYADGKNTAECARMIRATGQKKLLKAWFPDCPAAILEVLPKLPEKPLYNRTEYRRLIRALADKNQRKYLSRLARVRAFDVQLLDRVEILPAQFRLGAAHCDDVEDYEQLCVFIECVKRLNIKITAREFDALVMEANNLEGLWLYLARKTVEMPFPPPPWEGDGNIYPLRSFRELAEAGKRFNNCAAQYAFKVVTGRSYLYVCEQPPVMVEIVSDVFFGWMVHYFEGPDCESIPDEEALDIRRAFYNAGICQKTIGDDDIDCAGDALRSHEFMDDSDDFDTDDIDTNNRSIDDL